ncbi:MAG: hypothetical protein WC809_00560 [Sinimarinibacterium sp.]|jgi:hypothetical protein
MAMWRPGVAAVAGLTLLGLVGCGSSEGDAVDPGRTGNPGYSPDTTPTSALSEMGCSWVRIFDPVVDGLAFPDTSANYWLALVPSPGPLGRIRIYGRVPDVRYFAFNSYDAATAPYDAIADYEIAPDAFGPTPFLGPVQVDRHIPVGAQYTVDVEFAPVPQESTLNTLYSAVLASVADVAIPNTQFAPIVYRTYLPVGDTTGGAGLPEIRLEMADGSSFAVGGGDRCSATVRQIMQATGASRLVDVLNEVGQPPLPSQLPAPPGSTNPPTFHVFYGIPAGAQDAGIPVPDELAEGQNGGFFSTRSSRYAYAYLSRNFGELAIVRARAPRFVDQSGGRDPQLRYWSVCQNEFFTQHVFACAADHATVVADDGLFYIVISDGGDRPAAADAAHGFNWLPWGPFYDADVIYRHMLPAEDFAQAFHRIPRDADPTSIAGDYFPQATYCEPTEFETLARTRTPSQVFEACRRSAAP